VVKVRFGLRPRILLFTVLPIVTLAFAALWIVNRTTTRQVDRGIRDDLERSSAVLENVLSENERSLAITGLVIVRDPRFFSALTIPGVAADRQARATVEGVARDFDTLTRSDVFEVVDARGRLLASVGRDSTERAGRDPLVLEALGGRPVTRVLAHAGAHHLVCVAPAMAGGRVVGALVLGTRIGGALAGQLQRLTRSEVTFMSAGAVTGTTLADPGDRDAVVRALAAPPAATGALPVLHGTDHRYVTLVRPLPHAAADGQWYVMQRAVDVETAFLRSIQARLLELGVVALIVALIAGFAIAQRITGPVLRLVRGAEAMERGDFDYPVDAATGDEIATLATSFDGMRRRQREYIRTLEESARIRKEFIDVAAHELATPLTMIRGWQEMLADGSLGPMSAGQRRAVDVTLDGVGRLEAIAANATRIRDAELAGAGLSPADHDVDALVDEALAQSCAAAGARRVDVTARVEPGLEARVDGPRLVTAVVQLVNNGIRFTPDGGRVELRAQREGDVLAIEVRDTGVGIAPERIAGLLDGTLARPEARNHHSSSTLEFDSAGMGLGLQVVRAVAAAHGGRLTCMSAPGAGTTFTLRLPAVAEAAGEADERRAA